MSTTNRAVLVMLVAACTTSQPDPTPQPQQGLPVATCMSGWMYSTPDSGCSLACKRPTPECAASDCIQRTFSGYLSGVDVEAVVSYSASLGTMSTVADVTKGTYQITGDTTYVLTPPGGSDGTITASCVNGDLVDTKSGGALTSGTRVPASGGFPQALDAQINAGNVRWSAVPVVP
jgi:hypothetical protein